MAVPRFVSVAFIICLAFNLAISDDEKEVEEDNKASFGDAVGESMKGMKNWFKGMAEGVKDKAEDSADALKLLSAGAKDLSEEGLGKAKGWAEDGVDKAKDWAEDSADALKFFSVAAKDMSEDGLDKAKGWAEGLGDSFSKAKEKFTETGEKMKEVIGDAMVNTKEEIESAASKMTNYAKDATGSMFKLLG